MIGNVHYQPVNDMSWHSNQILMASSSDGYCSVITMSPDDEINILGKRLTPDQIEDEVLREHYQHQATVDFAKFEQKAMSQKT